MIIHYVSKYTVCVSGMGVRVKAVQEGMRLDSLGHQKNLVQNTRTRV